MIFLVLSGRMIFLFPENIMLPLRRKMKDDLSQKNNNKKTKKKHGNMIFSSNVLKRWSFQKELSWGMTFLVLSGRWYFFPKNMIFFLERKVRDDLSQKIHGNMIFSVCTHGCYKRGTTPLLPPPPLSRKSKMVLSHKNTPKNDLLSRFTF